MPKSFLIRSKSFSRSKYLSRDSSSSVNDVINTSHQEEAQKVIFTDESKTPAGPEDASKLGARYSDVISLINKKDEFGTKMKAINFSLSSSVVPNQSMKSISTQIVQNNLNQALLPVFSPIAEIYMYKSGQNSEGDRILPLAKDFQNRSLDQCTVNHIRKDYASFIQNAMLDLMFRNSTLISLINSKGLEQLNENNNVNNNVNNKPECQLCIHHHHDEKHLQPTSTRASRQRSSRKFEHTTGEYKSLQCLYCKKSYRTLPAFSMHLRTHTRGFPCNQCGKTFSRPWLLQGHIRTHTGDKPYECAVCGKRFSDRSNQRAHLQTHSSLKPYLCSRCGKTFTLKSYLYKHQEFSCVRQSQCHEQDRPTIL